MSGVEASISYEQNTRKLSDLQQEQIHFCGLVTGQLAFPLVLSVAAKLLGACLAGSDSLQ